MKKLGLVLICLCVFSTWSEAVVRAPQAAKQDKNISEQFWQAVRAGDEAQVSKLIKKDKSLVFKQQKSYTAYLWAVDRGNKKMAWLLADSFSRLTAVCEKGNALHIAVENQDFGMLKLVMKATQMDGDDVLTNLINSPRLSAKPGQKRADMNTPLHCAAQLCQRDVYEYLVSFGGNEKAPNAAFQTPKELLQACPPAEKGPKKAKAQ